MDKQFRITALIIVVALVLQCSFGWFGEANPYGRAHETFHILELMALGAVIGGGIRMAYVLVAPWLHHHSAKP